MGDQGPGIPGWFIGLAIIVIMLGIGGTIWRVSVTRRIAEDAGLNPDTATQVALLSQNGIDTAFLASTLASRSQQHAPAAVPPPPKSAEQRLQELQALKDKGLVTADEYEAQRKQILDSI